MQQPPYQPPPYQAGPPPPRQLSWLSRNMGCAIGLGCLAMVIAGAVFFFGIFGIVFGAMRSSDAYKVAVSTASANPTVVAELGTPIEPGWFTSGKVNTTGSTGHAELSIPISGPRSSATITAVADKAGGTWTFSTLSVTVDGKPTPIDLLPALPP
jgi:hypothetical protein